jgi:hypothetical protein
MNLSTLDNALWAASLVGHAALLLVLLWKKRARDFPIFTAFVASEVFRTVLLFLVLRCSTKHGYFLAYWITGFANYFFQVGLIFEIARQVLRPTGRWILEARRSFLVWAAAGLGVAAVMALEVNASQSKGLNLWDTRITIFTALMICGLFLAMVLAANRLGLRWRSQVFAIGQGLFLWAFIALLSDAAHTALGWNRDFILLDHIAMFTYLAVLTHWIVVFWRPETARAELSPEIRAYLLAAHQRLAYDSRSAERHL